MSKVDQTGKTLQKGTVNNMNKTGNCDTDDIVVNGAGLMEKGSLESKRPKVAAYWRGTHQSGMPDTGHRDYLTRLTSLRDSLVDQEQMYLAKAVERLRAHSQSNKNSSSRLRMNGYDIKISTASANKIAFMTTAEKFRQMRPPEPQPVVLPVHGKQIFDGNQQKRPSRNEDITPIEGWVNNQGADSRAGETSPPLVSSKVEDIVNSNLLRVTQSTRSIRNIDKNSNKNRTLSESKTKSLLNLRSPVHKHIGRYASVHALQTDVTRTSSSSWSANSSPENSQQKRPNQKQVDISGPIIQHPDILQLDDNIQNDANVNETMNENSSDDVNFERLESSGSRRNDDVNGFIRGNRSYTTPQESSSNKTGLRNRYRMSYNQAPLKKSNKSQIITKSAKILYGFKKSYFVKHTNDDDHCIDIITKENTHKGNRRLTEQYKRTTMKNESENGEESRVPTFNGKEECIPGMNQFESGFGSTYKYSKRNKKLHDFTNDTVYDFNIIIQPIVIVQSGKELESRTRRVGNYNGSDKNAETQENGTQVKQLIVGVTQEKTQGNTTQKKHLVVDMPSIIFNAPSPAPDVSDDIGDDWEKEGQEQNIMCQSSIRDTTKQDDKRITELSSLLEDVKELSMKTETLKIKPPTDVTRQREIF